MFLKKIELVGFKSFANPTRMEFKPGIMAIVGPNGCGKSNISDAIRWVLGEQSAKSLRADYMQDIIFSGSQSRKPVNFGEVSLTLDNTDQTLPLDFSEIRITRRVYREGDSQYVLNNQDCRLKDIVELFMDSGIGREAYSIIGQGKVDEILSTRSELRRGIFEEAAGIIKYKSRKKEALKKLEHTERNLLRIHDLVVELESQLNPLQQQAGKASRFKLLKDKLIAKEIALTVNEMQTLHNKWGHTKDQVVKLQKNCVDLAGLLHSQDALLEEERFIHTKLEKELEQLQNELLKCSEATEKAEGFSEVLQERKNFFSQEFDRLHLTLETGHTQLTTACTQAEELKAQQQKIAGKLAEAQASLQQEEQGMALFGENAEKEQQIKADLFEILHKTTQLKTDIRYIQEQQEVLARRMERNVAEETKRQTQHEKLQKKWEQLNALRREEAALLKQVEQQQKQESSALKELKQQIEQEEATYQQGEKIKSALISRRDTIKELQNDHEGFHYGVQQVLQAAKKGDIQGIHGAIAELVSVPKPYEFAMEAAFGASLQHLVVENEKAAREAISYLKRKKYGRATFLPIHTLSSRKIPGHDLHLLQRSEGCVGIAFDLVTSPAPYTAVLSFLLGQVIVARNLAEANQLAASVKFKYRVVTLGGDVVHVGGAMTGGSTGKKRGSLLNRAQQVETLTQQVNEMETSSAQIKAKLMELKQAASSVQFQIADLDSRCIQYKLSEQKNYALSERFLEEEKDLAEQKLQMERERSVLQAEQKSLQTNRLEAISDLAELKAQDQALQEDLQARERFCQQQNANKEVRQNRLTEQKVEIARIQQRLQAITEQKNQNTEEVSRLKKVYEEAKVSLADKESADRKTAQESILQREKLKALLQQKNFLSEQLAFRRADRAAKKEKISKQESETKELQKKLKQAENDFQAAQIAVHRLDVQLDNGLRKLSETYSIGFELAQQKYILDSPVEQVEQEVRDLKREIASLGQVNLGAIEEFDRLSERFAFLATQEKDLVAAKTKFKHITQSMDQEMSKHFQRTFEKIRREFRIVFTTMFGGGQADLILLDSNHVLDTGIEIVAQPPGKKLTNLQLLSGGERALTAVALLFAILQVNPVPFCVLDEVEAALDEPNVLRYARYLRQSAFASQFIVITHRKGTMEAADVLYGVTMEEPGISKLVTVKLEDPKAEMATA